MMNQGLDLFPICYNLDLFFIRSNAANTLVEGNEQRGMPNLEIQLSQLKQNTFILIDSVAH